MDIDDDDNGDGGDERKTDGIISYILNTIFDFVGL